MNKFKKKDGMILLFIDFRSAYNTINRLRLYEILRRNNILENREIKFLKMMQNNLFFRSINGEKIFMNNGVH